MSIIPAMGGEAGEWGGEGQSQLSREYEASSCHVGTCLKKPNNNNDKKQNKTPPYPDSNKPKPKPSISQLQYLFLTLWVLHCRAFMNTNLTHVCWTSRILIVCWSPSLRTETTLITRTINPKLSPLKYAGTEWPPWEITAEFWELLAVQEEPLEVTGDGWLWRWR